MISSAIPSVKYSFSGSALMLTNGSTAIDFGAVAVTTGTAPGGVAPAGLSAWANWAAVANRSAGSFASALMTACSTQGGTASRTERSGGTGSVKHFTMIAWAVGPVNGVRPASISYSTHPRLYTSLRPSSSTAPPACSGLMYAGVPTEVPVWVSVSAAAALTALAMPKSVTMASPSCSITFSGLMSRCTTRCRCA